MKIYNASKARANFFKMIEETVSTNESWLITSNAGNVVIISEDDYNSIQETLHINSVPNLTKNLIKEINEPLEDMVNADELIYNMYTIKLSKQALKDKEKLIKSNLFTKAKSLIGVLEINPFESSPPFINLYGDLKEFYARRLNWQHKLVYSVHENEKTVVIHSMWTHYE